MNLLEIKKLHDSIENSTKHYWDFKCDEFTIKHKEATTICFATINTKVRQLLKENPATSKKVLKNVKLRYLVKVKGSKKDAETFYKFWASLLKKAFSFRFRIVPIPDSFIKEKKFSNAKKFICLEISAAKITIWELNRLRTSLRLPSETAYYFSSLLEFGISVNRPLSLFQLLKMRGLTGITSSLGHTNIGHSSLMLSSRNCFTYLRDKSRGWKELFRYCGSVNEFPSEKLVVKSPTSIVQGYGEVTEFLDKYVETVKKDFPVSKKSILQSLKNHVEQWQS